MGTRVPFTSHLRPPGFRAQIPARDCLSLDNQTRVESGLGPRTRTWRMRRAPRASVGAGPRGAATARAPRVEALEATARATSFPYLTCSRTWASASESSRPCACAGRGRGSPRGRVRVGHQGDGAGDGAAAAVAWEWRRRYFSTASSSSRNRRTHLPTKRHTTWGPCRALGAGGSRVGAG